MEQNTSKLAMTSFLISPIISILLILFYFIGIKSFDNYLCKVVGYCLIDDWAPLLIVSSVILGIILSVISLIIIKKKKLRGKLLALISLIGSIIISILGTLLLILALMARNMSSILS
jgi:hypothetical protein